MRKILKLLGLICVIICSIFLLYNEGLLYLFGGYNLLRYIIININTNSINYIYNKRRMLF